VRNIQLLSERKDRQSGANCKGDEQDPSYCKKRSTSRRKSPSDELYNTFEAAV